MLLGNALIKLKSETNKFYGISFTIFVQFSLVFCILCYRKLRDVFKQNFVDIKMIFFVTQIYSCQIVSHIFGFLQITLIIFYVTDREILIIVTFVKK